MSQGLSFPTGADYVEALQNTQVCFRGTEMAGAIVQLGKLGTPRPISGNFASVFAISDQAGERYAVKCFTREVPTQAERYRAIGAHLADVDDDWKVGFEYQENGVLVRGRWYPILRMEWVEATSLTRWIENHLGDPVAFSRVAERFLGVTKALASSGIGHGDLQHGNILISPGGILRLVDYDGMYVPGLAGFAAAELGHRNYQSPARTGADFGPDIDRFSSWVVYLSLSALALDPSLWHRLRDVDAEQLLLAEQDFAEPLSSPRLATLLSHPEQPIRELACRFQDILVRQGDVPPELAPVVPNNPHVTFAAATAGASTGFGGLPSWLQDHVEPVAPPQPVRFSKPSRAQRSATIALAVVLVVAAVLVVQGVIGSVFAGALSLVLIVVWSVATVHAYRASPGTVDALKARMRLQEAFESLEEATNRVDEADRKTDQFKRAVQQSTQRLTQRQTKLRADLDRELVSCDRAAQVDALKIQTQLDGLTSAKDHALRAGLRPRQDQFVQARLAREYVTAGVIPGVGEQLVANLRAAGITTAADFVGVRFQKTRYQNNTAYFERTRGGSVRVEGIGEVKARRLDTWRHGRETAARLSQPMSLTPAEQAAIGQRFEGRRVALQAEQDQVRTRSAGRKAVLRTSFERDWSAVIDESQRAMRQITQDREANAKDLVVARSRTAAAQAEVRAAKSRASAYRQVTYRSYLWTVLTG